MKFKKLSTLLLAFGYVLGIHKGRVALWRSGQEESAKIFPVRVEMLPSAEQKLLRDGIPIEDGTKLAEILEDYLS